MAASSMFAELIVLYLVGDSGSYIDNANYLGKDSHLRERTHS
jgi:hypothetical protein